MENRITRILRQSAEVLKESSEIDGWTLWDIVAEVSVEDGMPSLTKDRCRMVLNMAVPIEDRDETFYYYIQRRVKDKKAATWDILNQAIKIANEKIDAEEAAYLETGEIK